MNPGILDQRIKVLELDKEKYKYSWEEKGKLWAGIEYSDKVNIFSKNGIGTKTMKFMVRASNISLFNALEWKDKHYFISDIKEYNRAFYEITTAQIEPRECKLIKNYIKKDELNRPKSRLRAIYTFPGYLVEKYMGYQQLAPQAQNDLTYVLVTPKVIKLNVGDLVKIEDNTYNVRIIHDLDEYKNEYEINIIKEA